jgi:hypothetical protein
MRDDNRQDFDPAADLGAPEPRGGGPALLLVLLALLLVALAFVFRVELGLVSPPPAPSGFTDVGSAR